MLFSYFLKRFFTVFFLAFSGLTILFALANFYIRLPTTGTLQTLSIVFWNMLPLTSFFAIPLSSCFATHATIVSFFYHHEIEFLYFLSAARWALYKATLFFSLSLCIFYVPLVFNWGPHSYASSKQLLFTLARKELYQLTPQTMHTVLPGFSFFFKKKYYALNKEPIFGTLLLVLKKKEEYYLFTAQKGFIQKNKLILKQGSMYNNSSKHHYYAIFDDLKINLDNFFYSYKNKDYQQPIKFFEWDKLLWLKGQDKKVYAEFHKRVVQVIWQMIIPFLGLFGAFIFQRRNNLIGSFLFSGLLFLIMYIFLTLGQLWIQNTFVTLVLFYIPPILSVIIGLLLYRQKL
jgi:lipopolysaccharide export LptBFGC system permease protein LptF